MLCGELAVLQAPMLDGLAFDPFALFDDGCGPAEVGVGRRHVCQALVVASVVVVLDEGADLGLEVAGQEVVFEQDAVIRYADLRFMVWCQRSILPWVWGCIGAPRTWLMALASI